MEKLQKIGYKINEKFAPVLGKIDAVLVLPNGKLEAGADGRGDDKAAGF
jgi:gamma-glutamyltranspeptidase / glutathione hydrolase